MDKERLTTKISTRTETIINSLNNITDDNDKYMFILKSPRHPQLYSLIKLNKDNPVRPIVLYVTEHIEFKPIHSAKNLFGLIEKIKNMQLTNNAKSVSFEGKKNLSIISPDRLHLIN